MITDDDRRRVAAAAGIPSWWNRLRGETVGEITVDAAKLAEVLRTPFDPAKYRVEQQQREQELQRLRREATEAREREAAMKATHAENRARRAREIELGRFKIRLITLEIEALTRASSVNGERAREPRSRRRARSASSASQSDDRPPPPPPPPDRVARQRRASGRRGAS